MPLTRTHHHPATITTTTAPPRRRGGLFSRRRRAPRHAVATTTTTRRRKGLFSRRAAPVHHNRKPTIKDKISGALLRLKGSLTHRPAVKAAGTRRMRGTDGRGSRQQHRSHIL